MSSDFNADCSPPVAPEEQPPSLRLVEGSKILINGCPFEIKEINRRGLVLQPLRRVNYTVACHTMQVHSWPLLVVTEDREGRCVEIPPELIDRIEQLEQDVGFHPRAAKLMSKRKTFVVIAVDEPYFKQAFDLIRAREIEVGRWSASDEQAYQEAVVLNAEILSMEERNE